MPPLASPPSTSLSLVANVMFNGQSVSINTGDITHGLSSFVFSLTSPVTLGSLDDFVDTLSNEFGVPLTSGDITDAIAKIPTTPGILGTIQTALNAITTTALTVTVLNINVASGLFQLGVSFPVSIPLTHFLSFEGIGVMVTKPGTTGSPA